MVNTQHKCVVFVHLVIFLVLVVNPTIVVGQNSTINSRNETSTKLRLLVPVRPGLNKFVSIERHPVTGVQNFSGFAISVFEDIVKFGLPTTVPYQFVPFASPDGTMNGTFDEMLQAVAAEDYDGAIGEISILHYRTPWVDFTLPYLNSQISMLVRINQNPIGMGIVTISLASATKYIVAATLAFSFVVAIFFWFLEFKTHKHASQVNHSNSSDHDLRSDILRSITQTRLVIILFFMVMLILLACYSASQTSSLTTMQHQGATHIKNINELIKNKRNVGYRQGSFIRNLLIQKGIPESKLISLDSEEEMTEMLSKGSVKGGVDAIFGDSPNLFLFLDNRTEYCHLFKVVPASDIDTVGFGFAFNKETTLANEISEGMLKLIDNGRLNMIQQRTIGSLDACNDDDTMSVGSEQLLDPDSFWILIAGAVAVLVLMIIIVLLYCGLRRNGRKKKAIAYPCYMFPCC